MAVLTYHPAIKWTDTNYITAVIYKDALNLFVGDPVSWNTGAEPCDAGTTDDVTFMGLCLSKYTTALHSSADYVDVAMICHARPRLSTPATMIPGQMFIFGNDGRGTMVGAGSGNHAYGWSMEYHSAVATYPLIHFNAILLSGTAGHLFEDAAT